MNCPSCNAPIPDADIQREHGRIAQRQQRRHVGGSGRPRIKACSKCGQRDNPKCPTCRSRKAARARRERQS